jgi:hypothetical protein
VRGYAPILVGLLAVGLAPQALADLWALPKIVEPPVPLQRAIVTSPIGPIHVGDLVTVECTLSADTLISEVYTQLKCEALEVIDYANMQSRIVLVEDGRSSETVMEGCPRYRGSLGPKTQVILRVQCRAKECGQLWISSSYCYKTATMMLAGNVQPVLVRCVLPLRESTSYQAERPKLEVSSGIVGSDPDEVAPLPRSAKIAEKFNMAGQDSCDCTTAGR